MNEALTFYVCGERRKASPGLFIKTEENHSFKHFFNLMGKSENETLCSEYVNSRMLNTPLYWREKIQSCHPAADDCWMTLLLEERASLTPETAGEKKGGTKRGIEKQVKCRSCYMSRIEASLGKALEESDQVYNLVV